MLTLFVILTSIFGLINLQQPVASVIILAVFDFATFTAGYGIAMKTKKQG